VSTEEIARFQGLSGANGQLFFDVCAMKPPVPALVP
jgi:hypothetical protein